MPLAETGTGGVSERVTSHNALAVFYNKFNDYMFIHTATPEGAITAPVGSICINTGGGADTILYVKESGAGNTGWSALAGV